MTHPRHTWPPNWMHLVASAMVLNATPTGSDPVSMQADVAQLVERNLAKVEVASSSLVVRSERVSADPSTVGWPRGEATDCKSVNTGSNPVPTSGDWRSGSALP